ncbi:MAG TPA: hypothetical protein PK711_10870 [Bacteroidales bacterium]|nr:hypothetical protein [Bacteroidales bacterium]HRZ20928.1 hypothetical protein [Bacteroidales bacterium]
MEAFWQFITSHLAELIFGFLAFAEIIVRLTPTKKDDSILNFIVTIIDALFPNRKKDGGKFKLTSQAKEKDKARDLF